MSDCGCEAPEVRTAEERRVLRIALVLNAAMAVIGGLAGWIWFFPELAQNTAGVEALVLFRPRAADNRGCDRRFRLFRPSATRRLTSIF